MNDRILPSDRAKIYEAAWHSYCQTQSTYYAHSAADRVGQAVGIPPLRSNEIAREAIEKIQQLQNDYARQLAEKARDYAAAYVSRFRESSTSTYCES